MKTAENPLELQALQLDFPLSNKNQKRKEEEALEVGIMADRPFSKGKRVSYVSVCK